MGNKIHKRRRNCNFDLPHSRGTSNPLSIWKVWGKNGGRGWEDEKPLQKIGNLIIYSRYREVDPHIPIWSKECEGKVFWAKTWREVIEKIKAVHKGSIKVAVYPCAELQYPSGIKKKIYRFNLKTLRIIGEMRV